MVEKVSLPDGRVLSRDPISPPARVASSNRPSRGGFLWPLRSLKCKRPISLLVSIPRDSVLLGLSSRKGSMGHLFIVFGAIRSAEALVRRALPAASRRLGLHLTGRYFPAGLHLATSQRD